VTGRSVTVDELFRRGIQAGLTPQEVRRTRVRDLLLCQQAFRRQDRSDWQRALAIINAMPFRDSPLTLADLYDTPPQRQDRQEYEAFMGRTADWGQTLITDHSTPEL